MRGNHSSSISQPVCPEAYAMCVARRVPAFSLENCPCNILCCPGTRKVQGYPAARRLQRKRFFEVTFGLNAMESANTGTCPSGFSVGFQTFLLTGTDVRKIPGLTEKLSFFPANELSFRTTRFPFSGSPALFQHQRCREAPASRSLRGDPSPLADIKPLPTGFIRLPCVARSGLECVQKREKKLRKGLEHMSCGERLRKLGAI